MWRYIYICFRLLDDCSYLICFKFYSFKYKYFESSFHEVHEGVPPAGGTDRFVNISLITCSLLLVTCFWILNIDYHNGYWVCRNTHLTLLLLGPWLTFLVLSSYFLLLSLSNVSPFLKLFLKIRIIFKCLKI